MLSIRGLNKSYHTQTGKFQALKNINLTINKGEIFGVIGHSGAGKSTLIHCVNLLEKPDEGQILLDNIDITQLNKTDLRLLRRKIAMIFQHFNILHSRTVYQNVALPLELIKIPSKKIKEKVLPLLELTGLIDKKDYYPAKLSGGQKQRVAIARALTNDPILLLSDEATSALDPETTLSILQLLKKINQELNITILLITHEMNVIKQICDQVAFIQQGEIIEQNNTVELFLKPKSPLTKTFVESGLHITLPESIKNILSDKGDNPLIRVLFNDENVKHPIITKLIKDFNLSANILQANLENVSGKTIGFLLIELVGSELACQKGINYLLQLGLTVEQLGYVKHHDNANT